MWQLDNKYITTPVSFVMVIIYLGHILLNRWGRGVLSFPLLCYSLQNRAPILIDFFINLILLYASKTPNVGNI